MCVAISRHSKMALEKDKAAVFLGCSPRQLERYVKDNRITVSYEHEPGRTRKKPVFDEAELQRLKTELEAPTVKPVVLPHNPQNEVTTNNDGALSLLSPFPESGQNGAAILAAIADVASKAAVDAIQQHNAQQRHLDVHESAAKLFLTVPEAAQLAGVSKSAIEGAIKAGYIKAHNGLGRGRRIKRADVEKWVAAL